MSSLTILNLSRNSIGGELPTDLEKLGKLEYLDLSDNDLSGTIPEDIGELLTSLIELDLHDNKLEGPIEFLENLSTLRDLFLQENEFTGNIPDVDKLSSITDMRVYGNLDNAGDPALTGSIEPPDCTSVEFHVDTGFSCDGANCDCTYY